MPQSASTLRERFSSVGQRARCVHRLSLAGQAVFFGDARGALTWLGFLWVKTARRRYWRRGTIRRSHRIWRSRGKRSSRTAVAFAAGLMSSAVTIMVARRAEGGPLRTAVCVAAPPGSPPNGRRFSLRSASNVLRRTYGAPLSAWISTARVMPCLASDCCKPGEHVLIVLILTVQHHDAVGVGPYGIRARHEPVDAQAERDPDCRNEG